MMSARGTFYYLSKLFPRRRRGNPVGLSHIILTPLIIIVSVSVSAGDDSGKHNAVILEEATDYTISGTNRASHEIYRKIEIRNEKGRRHGHASIYETPFLKLRDFECTIYDADGTVVENMEEKDGKEVCGYGGYALYSELCYRYFTPTCNTYPYTVEYRYRIEQKSLFFWPDWKPGRSIPVRRSRYTLTCPNDIAFVVKTSGELEPDSVKESGKKTRYYYSAEDVPTVWSYECGIGDSTGLIKARFAPTAFKLDDYEFDNAGWPTLGRDVHTMYRKCYGINNPQRALMDSLVAETDDKRELIDRLHHVLAGKSRYVAIEIGIGSWQPSKSEEAFKRGYGDCKDLSTMYASMLEYSGIEAKPVLLLTRSDGFIDPDFPVINRFNHAILFAVADNDTVWIDPTCQTCEVGDLLAHDEDTYVLVIDSTSSGLIKTPRSIPENNLVRRTAHIKINSDKSIEVSARIGLSGNDRHDLVWLIDNIERDKLDDYCKSSYQWLTPRIDIDSLSCRESQDDDSSMAGIEIHGKIRNAVHKIGDKRYLNVTVFPCLSECEKTGPFDDDLTSLDLDYPRKYLDSIVINLPENWRPTELPIDTGLFDDFGSASIAYTLDGDKLIISRSRESAVYSIDRGKFSEYGAHIEAIQELFPDRMTFIYETGDSTE
jgi:hypothetical protein